jgi:hypothetical protein
MLECPFDPENTSTSSVSALLKGDLQPSPDVYIAAGDFSGAEENVSTEATRTIDSD